MQKELTTQEVDLLDSMGRDKYAKKGLLLWIRASEQILNVISDNYITATYACSTAEAGLGNKQNSFQTPLGWHIIAEKIGENLPAGAVLKSRKWTGEIWTSEVSFPVEDLILSRILWLAGLEPGINQGNDTDTYNRYIYIHGTHKEELIGKAVSKGCIRLRNEDIIQLFDEVPVGTKVIVSKE